MKKYTFLAPCHFGLEAILKREIYDLGYDIDRVDDGRVFFTGDEEAIALSNINLRTAERVLLVTGIFKAFTYEDFFQGMKNIEWENYLPKEAKFWVKKASSIKSKLYSSTDLQSVGKKAIVERLKNIYNVEHFKEDGNEYPIRIFIYKDEVVVSLDTTGDSLHKRGYRTEAGKAPISETLAAALIKLTPWHKDRILVDPMCGSGTFVIEAAMMAANIAPGLNRHFISEKWENLIKKSIWKDIRDEARENINIDIETDIQGYDIDSFVIRVARENAKRAGVDNLIHFQKRDVKDLHHPKKYGFIITNPPYGERLEEKKDLPILYKTLGESYKNLDSWSMYIITSYEEAEKYIGIKATKNRKIYNGMIKTYFYQFIGPKPKKKKI